MVQDVWKGQLGAELSGLVGHDLVHEQLALLLMVEKLWKLLLLQKLELGLLRAALSCQVLRTCWIVRRLHAGVHYEELVPAAHGCGQVLLEVARSCHRLLLVEALLARRAEGLHEVASWGRQLAEEIALGLKLLKRLL